MRLLLCLLKLPKLMQTKMVMVNFSVKETIHNWLCAVLHILITTEYFTIKSL